MADKTKLTPLTDPANDPQFHIVDDDEPTDMDGFTDDELDVIFNTPGSVLTASAITGDTTETLYDDPETGHSGETESFAVRTGNAPVRRVGAGDVTPSSRSIGWDGVLAVEGVETGDGREFAPNSLTWPELPIPLMYQYETSHGGTTDKSVNVGNITHVWRDGNRIMGKGTIDLGDPYGMQAARKIKGQYLRGVSIDADSVKAGDIELVFSQGDDPEANPSMMPLTPDKTIFHNGRVRGATMVNLPAFVEASLNLTGDLSMLDEVVTAGAVINVEPEPDTHVITAAATTKRRGFTIEIPELPPLEYFQEPKDLPPIGAVWIEPNGHIWGLVGPSNVAHRAFQNKRVTIPMGNVDYTAWMNRPTLVEGPDGEVLKIRTGVITMNCGHLNPYASTDPETRMSHYDNSCSIAAVVRVGESRTHKAPWVSGTIMPMSAADFQRFQACQLSGDWAPHRDRRGWKEFVASLAVPVPGFARSTDVAAVRVDDNAVVVASSVPIHISEHAYIGDVVSDDANRTALAHIRQQLGGDRRNRQNLEAIRLRMNGGLTASAATMTPAKKEKKTVSCGPCGAKRRAESQQTSAQTPPVQQVPGIGDGNAEEIAQTSASNAIANTRLASRG